MLVIAGGIVIGFFAIAIVIALLPLIIRGVGLLLFGVALFFIIIIALPNLISELVEIGYFASEEFGRPLAATALSGLLAAWVLPRFFSVTQTGSYFAGIGFMTFVGVALDLMAPSFSRYLLVFRV